MAQSNWSKLVADKQARQQASMPKEWILPESALPAKDVQNVFDFPEQCGLLEEKEVEITRSSVEVLLANLARSKWSAVEVTKAFAKRAIIAHQITNCLTEILIDRALVKAAELDEHLKRTGKVVGPLHGLPISLKDQISIEGVDSTMGYISWINKPAEKHSVLAGILEDCGAVLYVKTNIPQTLMWPETFNHIFGRTTNPHNRNLTPGGSSGGEGALIALKGSPIGAGSDIGGSIRIPSACCGLYGLRPSYGRIPYAGSVNSLEGQDSLPSVLGPISGSIEGIKIWMKAVISKEPWRKDPLCVRKKWDEDAYRLVDHGSQEQDGKEKKLCYAIMWDDGFIKPHPPILRGLQMVKEALIAKGHQVVDWKAHKHDELYDSAGKIFGAGIAEDVQAVTALSGEPWILSMIPSEDGDGAPAPLDLFTDSVGVAGAEAAQAAGVTTAEALRDELAAATTEAAEGDDESKGTALHASTQASAFSLWQLHKQKRDLRQEHLDYWEASRERCRTETGRPVDAIIAPCAPFCAPKHGGYTNARYTTVWNVLDYPALVVPVSKVSQELDTKQPREEFYGDEDKTNYDGYEPGIYENAPVCVQVIGRTLEEEAVIRMAEIVDEAVEGLYEAKLLVHFKGISLVHEQVV